MQPPSGRYRSSESLVVRECDEGYLVYDEARGRTSVIDARAGELLQRLLAAPATIDAAGQPALQSLLRTLEDSGLIQPC